MYSKEFQESLKAVEAAREANIAYEPARMTADEKDALLAAYHPDYKKSEFSELKIGPNTRRFPMSFVKCFRPTAAFPQGT